MEVGERGHRHGDERDWDQSPVASALIAAGASRGKSDIVGGDNRKLNCSTIEEIDEDAIHAVTHDSVSLTRQATDSFNRHPEPIMHAFHSRILSPP